MREELGIGNVEELWTWATTSKGSGPGAGRDLPVGDDVVYRGQSDAAFGLTSSLYRLCRAALPHGVREKRLAEVEAKVLDEMREQGLGRRMSDGQLLAVLQHHGVPTRLIDFSTGPLEALFFAVEDRDAVDGRMFVVHAHGNDWSIGTKMDLQESPRAPLPWAAYARGPKNAVDVWTQTVAVADPCDLDPRMVAQRGVFLVGGLNRRSAGRSMFSSLPGDGSQAAVLDLPSESYADVTSLGIHFVKTTRTRNRAWPATGWTFTIPHGWKPELRRRLAGLKEDPIRRDTMYPPLNEVSRLANYAVLADLAQGARA